MYLFGHIKAIWRPRAWLFFCFSLALPRGPRTPQSSTFDRAAGDRLSEQTRLSIICCNHGPKRFSPGTRALAHCRTARIHRVHQQRRGSGGSSTMPISAVAPLSETRDLISGLNRCTKNARFHLAHHHCGALATFRTNEWVDVRGFVKRPNSQR